MFFGNLVFPEKNFLQLYTAREEGNSLLKTLQVQERRVLGLRESAR